MDQRASRDNASGYADAIAADVAESSVPRDAALLRHDGNPSFFDGNDDKRRFSTDQALCAEIGVFRRLGHTDRMISPAQCRAARGLLSWTQADLAKAASVGVVTVRQFESENGVPRSATLTVLRQAFEAAGVEFIPANGGGPGVRLREGRIG